MCYILGLAKNARLEALVRPALALTEAGFAATGTKQRRFAELTYGARSWDRMRRVVARIEHGPRGANPRFVVTNLAGDGRDLYERLYCVRAATWRTASRNSSCSSSPTAPRATDGGPTSSAC